MNKRNFTVTVAHFAFLFILFTVLFRYDLIDISPFNTNLILWDTYWYDQMRLIGYSYVPSTLCNLAFFPLFPMIWKASSLTAIGICFFNLVLFITGFNLLLGKTKYPIGHVLALISLPSFIFFILPYSESLFFICGSILLIGYSKQSNWLICIGLLGCGLTRSVSTFFIPAIIMTELLQYRFFPKGNDLIHAFKNMALYAAVCLISVGIVTALQVGQTGKWFYFLTVQKYWGRHFQLPSLPFTTKAPEKVLAVDTVALVIGLIAVYLIFLFVITFIVKKKTGQSGQPTPSRALLFSLLYLASITTLDSFFTSDYGGRTNLWSLNRHLLCTPFFLFFLNWFSSSYKPIKTEKLAISVIVLAGVFLTWLFDYPYLLLYYLIFFLSILVNTLLKKDFYNKYSIVYFSPLYFFNILFWLVFYHSFLHDKWIG